MFGYLLRSKVGGWYKKYIPLILSTPFFKGYFNDKEEERVVRYGTNLTLFVIDVATIIGLMWLFSNYFYDKLGFEKTIIYLLVIIMFILRSNNHQ